MCVLVQKKLDSFSVRLRHNIPDLHQLLALMFTTESLYTVTIVFITLFCNGQQSHYISDSM